MIDRMLESSLTEGPRGLSSASVSVAVAGHLTLAACLAAAVYLVVENVDVPEQSFVPPVIVTVLPPAPPPRHPPGGGNLAVARGGGNRREQERRDVSTPVPPTPVAQPVLDPDDARPFLADGPLHDEDLGPIEGLGAGNGEGPGGGGIGSGSRGGAGTGDGFGPGTGGAPMRVIGDVVAPELLERVQPVYPEAARKARLGGKVFLQALIRVDGSVDRVEVLSATNPIFEEAAVTAVRRWKYKPAHYHGTPVAVYFTVTVSFVVH